jgi:hypothetical protein
MPDARSGGRNCRSSQPLTTGLRFISGVGASLAHRRIYTIGSQRPAEDHFKPE